MIGSQPQNGSTWRRIIMGLCLGGAMTIGVQAGAEVVVYDTFDDGDRADTVADPLDINWFSANGQTTPTTPGELPRNKPELTIMDDTPTSGAGLDSGNAMFVEAVGIGSEYVGIFPETISLGSNVGDKLELSFDWRVWASGDGSPTTATAPDSFPFAGELRFGLYEDTDNELDRIGGGDNPWGNDDGLFDGDEVPYGNAGDDVGVMCRLGLTMSPNSAVGDSLLQNIRIAQEGGTEGRVLGGNDMDFVAQPTDADEDGIADTWPLISTTDKYTVKLILERVDVVNADGDNIFYTMELYDSNGTLLESFGDTDALDEDPYAYHNAPQVDGFDYLILANTTGNYDSVIDNVKIELISGAIVIPGDLDGDGFVGLDDLDIILTRWNTTVPAGELLQGDPSGDGFVGLDDLDIVLNNWNSGTPSSAGVIPEPASIALLGLGWGVLLRRSR